MEDPRIPTVTIKINYMCKGLNSLLLGLNDGNPYNGYIKPLHYRVDDHHILYGNIGSLDALDSRKFNQSAKCQTQDTSGGVPTHDMTGAHQH